MNQKNEFRVNTSVIVKAAIVLFLSVFVFLSWDVSTGQARSHRTDIRSYKSKRVKTVRYRKAYVPKVRRSVKKRRRSKRVQAKAVYCVNLASNRTMFARNADRQLPVASLTKLVTAMVVLDRMPLHKKVVVPKHVRRVPKSRVGLRPGDRVSIKDLLHGLLMQSGNDCAETLACVFPGGRRHFIRKMNLKARDLGAKKTVLYTPSGLDSKVVKKRKGKKCVRIRSNVSTAREIARIARAAFSNRTIRTICRKRSYVMSSAKLKRGYRVRSTNRLLADNLPIRGGKTGYTVRAGRCLATEFTPGRNIFVIVVLGSPNHFRDTRLIYRKALKKASKSNQRRQRRHSRYPGRAWVPGS